MKFIKIILLFSIILSISYGNKIAVATKVKGDVQLMKVETDNFLGLNPGTILSDGDKIVQGNPGLLLLFLSMINLS